MSMTARVLLLAGTAALFPSLSIAQTQTPIPPPPDEAFINISAGAQLQTHTFTSNTSFPLYDELATVSASQNATFNCCRESPWVRDKSTPRSEVPSSIAPVRFAPSS